VAANPRSKLIHKVMTLGKKVANERAFRERQRFGELLAGPSLEHSREQHPLADFRIAEVLHQSEVVKVSLHSAANARGLTDVQGLKVTPKAPSKYIHARPVGHLSEINGVNQVVPARISGLESQTRSNQHASEGTIREMAHPVLGRRSAILSTNRLGGHRTRQERRNENRSGAAEIGTRRQSARTALGDHQIQ
jgi:hypothetical protein